MVKKLLYLEYKFRDFSDKELLAPNPTGVMAAFEKLNQKRVEQIKRLGLEFGISLSLPSRDLCLANKQLQKQFLSVLENVIKARPELIWFDHMRFPGTWETKDRKIEYHAHNDCEYCENRDRKKIVGELAIGLKSVLPKNIKSGYFAVPYRKSDEEDWGELIGQDHANLGNLFDYVSPMLYHRMIRKSVSYIGEYIKYLSNLKISAKILPIVQLKDMPDTLPDKLSIEEIRQEIRQALKPPSVGIAVFSWDQTIEKNKINEVSSILREVV